jgi:hypothetical protein
LLALRHSDAGQAEVSEHVLAMSRALLPAFDRLARRIFVADTCRYILGCRSEWNCFPYLVQPFVEPAVTHISAAGHIDAVFFRFRANEWMEREKSATVRATKLVYLLMYARHQLWKVRVRLGPWIVR